MSTVEQVGEKVTIEKIIKENENLKIKVQNSSFKTKKISKINENMTFDISKLILENNNLKLDILSLEKSLEYHRKEISLYRNIGGTGLTAIVADHMRL